MELYNAFPGVLIRGRERLFAGNNILKEIPAINVNHAFFSASISNFFIFIKALVTRGAFAGSLNNFGNIVGTTCQETPNLSLSHPHWLSCPPFLVKLFQ